MTNPPAKPAGTDGTTEPSTRRVTSGPPAPHPNDTAGGSIFPKSSEDDVFADLKAKISRMWDEAASPEDIRSVLTDPKSNGR